ncbi:hypothetical protein AG1IA_08375 [Rhizoctonia solani AG-1 IA]|uniref:Uncharacterized protein n=1 Tax=Thanatephorus cucumeris (strain AG1-IA) TaxID=983506 RepID=L8WH97_THACA|nr:hypothetical protein AG1IA_08375 [Rhizoctonia solani AG-1 IA]
MEFLPSIALFDVRNWVVVVTGSEAEIINPLADILSRSGAHIYVCQPFLSDNDVPGEEQCPSQTFVNMDETNKASIANAVRIIETREQQVNLVRFFVVCLGSDPTHVFGCMSSSSTSTRKTQPLRENVRHGTASSADRGPITPIRRRSKPMKSKIGIECSEPIFHPHTSSPLTHKGLKFPAFGTLLRNGAELYGTGCVINVSRPGKPLVVGGYGLPTLYGSRIGQPSASDTALQQLNNLLATELNSPTEHRIRVNAIVLRQPVSRSSGGAVP